ncbi:hypothetical protein LEP1GSC008_2816 [Leptospira kirschneri serovar Bulgarica str. Nikolaevo]|uniref:Uncharacterized protein n=1 Tax=Leptospira kirschneri serovar Bulgarica str. Nikolaevo TaxID=1240687 RepID=M6FDI2_9LEPT|nr:hypothetical protein LEP1GSC008_2816 [Leptospira kirschneri serovar Bulgarica str. Nikolaevo]
MDSLNRTATLLYLIYQGLPTKLRNAFKPFVDKNSKYFTVKSRFVRVPTFL